MTCCRSGGGRRGGSALAAASRGWGLPRHGPEARGQACERVPLRTGIVAVAASLARLGCPEGWLSSVALFATYCPSLYGPIYVSYLREHGIGWPADLRNVGD